MSELSTAQLAELAARVNERRAEFGPQMFDPLSPGEVRLLFDVIEAWMAQTDYLQEDGPPALIDSGLRTGDCWPGSVSSVLSPESPVAAGVGYQNGKDDLGGNGSAPVHDPPAIHAPQGPIRLPRTLAEVDAQATAHPKPEKVNSRPNRHGNYLPTLDEMVAEVKRQAMGGTMPTMSAFNDARPGNWASAGAQVQRLGVSWDELRQLAELQPNRVSRSDPDFSAIEAEKSGEKA